MNKYLASQKYVWNCRHGTLWRWWTSLNHPSFLDLASPFLSGQKVYKIPIQTTQRWIISVSINFKSRVKQSAMLISHISQNIAELFMKRSYLQIKCILSYRLMAEETVDHANHAQMISVKNKRTAELLQKAWWKMKMQINVNRKSNPC